MFLALLILLLPYIAWAQTTYTCGTHGVDDSCLAADLNTLVGTAVDGDTIRIADGTHDWSGGSLPNGVNVTKRITIDGGGSCPTCGTVFTPPTNTWPSTIDTGTSNNKFVIFQVTGAGSEEFRITGVHLRGTTNFNYNWFSDTGHGNWIGEARDNIARYRIDNNRFENTSGGASYTAGDVQVMSINAYGVIYRNFFDHLEWDGHMISVQRVDLTNSEDGFDPPGSEPVGSQAQTEAPQWGSNNFVFVEDNSFKFGTANCPAEGSIFGPTTVDYYIGGRVVFRYNYIKNGIFGPHDLSGGFNSRGANAGECYENTFDWDPCGPTTNFPNPINLRSGTLLVYANDFGSDYQYLANMFYDGHSSWGTPDCPAAFHPQDDSGPPRCLDQLGRSQSANATYGTAGEGFGTQQLNPVRWWSNTGSGCCDCGAECADPPPENGNFRNQEPSIFRLDTEYYISADDSEKQPGYTAYTYPHPDRGEGGINSPMGVTVSMANTTYPSTPSGLSVSMANTAVVPAPTGLSVSMANTTYPSTPSGLSVSMP